MSDREQTTGKKAEKVADEEKSVTNKSGTNKPGTNKPSPKKASKKKAATAKPVVKAEKIARTITSSPTISKAGATTDADMKSAARKLSDVDKKAADDAIRSKQSAEDLKARASEAKERARQKILDESFVGDKVEDPLERLANTFDSSAKRWEMVVYPSLFAFVLLAGYGFFLIYRLTHDISTLSQSVTRMAVIVSDAMPRMTKDLNVMTGSIDDMTGNIDGMSTEMSSMSGEISSMSGQMDTLTPMSNNIQSMTHNIGSMNRSVYGMQRDMHGMNRTVSSGPFGMMNDMMPFSSSSNVPPPMAPPPVWPSYTPYPNQAYSYPGQQPGSRQPVSKQAINKPAAARPSTASPTANKPAGNTSKGSKPKGAKPAGKKPTSKKPEAVMSTERKQAAVNSGGQRPAGNSSSAYRVAGQKSVTGLQANKAVQPKYSTSKAGHDRAGYQAVKTIPNWSTVTDYQ